MLPERPSLQKSPGHFGGVKMSRWIRGIQLVHPPYDLREVELLALVVEKGLQPYEDDGSPIPCPRRCHAAYALQELPFHQMDDGRKREVARRLEEIKRDPERWSWKYFFLGPTDPLRKKILHDKIYPLLWKAIFLKEDLERLGLLLPEVESPGPLHSSTEAPVEESDAIITRISFINKDNRWLIGLRGRELQFQAKHRGFVYLHESLKSPNEFFDVQAFYNISSNLAANSGSGAVYSGWTQEELAEEGLYRDSAVIREVTKEDKEGGAHLNVFQIKKVKEAMYAYQEELDELNEIIPDLLTEDQETRIRELEESIKLFKSQLRDTDTSAKGVIKEKVPLREKMRSSVTTSINDAIKRINKDLPFMQQFLNKRTIKTGFTVGYRPDPNNPVQWITEVPNPEN
jgi:hypothetical protein